MIQKTNLIIFGVGQLGSRHLQGLAGIGDEYRIFAFDPSEESLTIAKTRWEEASGVEEIRFISSLDELSEFTFDLAIVATNANHRLEAIQFLLKANTKFFILEKVLFQNLNDYTMASDLFQSQGAQVYVNCPRRLFVHYQDLHELLKDEQEMFMTVSGANWGLACNAIHMIDLFSFLGAGKELIGDSSGLHDGYFESKRKGYYEVSGTMAVHSVNGLKSLYLYSGKQGLPGIKIQITTVNFKIEVDESIGELKISSAEGTSTRKFSALFQSQMTGDVVKTIFSGKCQLTPFEESKSMHLAMMKPLTIFFEAHNYEYPETCPIT